MNLTDARKAKIPREYKFIVGRGDSSGKGKYCGRGNKGQWSRQGTSFRYYFEGGQMPIIRRLPKRGFNNNEFRTTYEEVNVGTLDRLFPDGAVIDEAALRGKRLVRRDRPIKILGDGPCAKKFTVRAHKFTKSAEEKIRKAGGTTALLEAPACAAAPAAPAAAKAPEPPKPKPAGPGPQKK